jgi:hypothetical protein
MDQPGRPRITDSGWFWATVFSAMSLAGIGLIAGKFEVRQRQVEGRFLGRQKAAEERVRRSAGLPPVDLAVEADRDVRCGSSGGRNRAQPMTERRRDR